MTRTPDHDLAFARDLARHVVDRLGPDAPQLLIGDIGYEHDADRQGFDGVLTTEPSDHIRIDVRVADPDASRIGAFLTVTTPHEQAIVATATHIQDYVLEYTHGDPLPPCPGHRHPLQASVVDGVACWVCPKDPDHHIEPILPAGTVDPSPSGRGS